MPNIVVFGSSMTDFTFSDYRYDEENGSSLIAQDAPLQEYAWPHWFGEYFEDVNVYNYARCTHGLNYSMYMMDMLIERANADIHELETYPDTIDLAIIEIPTIVMDYSFCGPDKIGSSSEDNMFIRHKYKNNYSISTKTPTLIYSKLFRLENVYDVDEKFKNIHTDIHESSQRILDLLDDGFEARAQAQRAKTRVLEYYQRAFKELFGCELLIFYWTDRLRKCWSGPNNFSDIDMAPQDFMRQYENVMFDDSHLNTNGSKIFFDEYFLKSNKFQEISKDWTRKVK